MAVQPTRRRWPWLTPRRILIAGGGLAAAILLAALALRLSLPDVDALRTANPSTTAFIELRRRQADERGERFELRFTWRPLARISPLLRRAVLHAEDARFFQHEGVDWEAVKQTAERNWKEGSMRRGGSTITQQVAKNLYLSPRRSLTRKLRELLIAWRLEDALSKERILEIYLNVAEWGDGVFGAEAAARRWYRRSAAELTADQAARLAVALPNPFERSPRKRSRVLDRKAARIVRALHRGGLISAAELERALRALNQRPTHEAPPPAPGERDEDLAAAPAEPDPLPAPAPEPDPAPDRDPDPAPDRDPGPPPDHDPGPPPDRDLDPDRGPDPALDPDPVSPG